MKKSQKIILAVCLVVVIIAIVATACILAKKTKQNEDNIGGNVNNSGDLITSSGDEMYLNVTKKVGDVEISDIKITLVEKNNCRIEARVKNTGDKFLEATNLEIKAIDDEGADEIFGGLVTALAPQEESMFVTYVLSDIMDAHDVEIAAIE